MSKNYSNNQPSLFHQTHLNQPSLLDLIAETEAAPAKPAVTTCPRSIVSLLERYISEIKSFNAQVLLWRAMDQKHASQGRYEADCFINAAKTIESAQNYISKFLSQCLINGFDGKQLLEDLGYEPVIEESQASRYYREF